MNWLGKGRIRIESETNEQEHFEMPQESKISEPPLAVQRYAPPEQRDQRRDVVKNAAELYDQVCGENTDLKDKLYQAVQAIEQRDMRIQHLELALAEERNNAANYRAIRDEAMDEVLSWRGMVANIKAMLDRFETPLPHPPKRRKKENGDKESDLAANLRVDLERIVPSEEAATSEVQP